MKKKNYLADLRKSFPKPEADRIYGGIYTKGYVAALKKAQELSNGVIKKTKKKSWFRNLFNL